MTWITAHWDVLLLVATNLLALAAAVVKLTPSTSDDEWIAKIESVVNSIVNKPKPPSA